MIPMSAITINWTGLQLTAEQQIIIHDAALDFEHHNSEERLVFEHPLCDGMIECKGRMILGIYAGTRYLATLDGTDGKPRTYEFLLTDFHTKSSLRASEAMIRFTPATGASVRVESKITRKTRTTSLKRSRLN